MKNLKKKISEQTTTGPNNVSAGGHADIALGMFDRPGPSGKKFGQLPVLPSQMVATQLATERPPIDDDEYVPSSMVELTLAASEVAKLVPDEKISNFYQRIKDLAQKMIDDKRSEDLNTKGETDMKESARSYQINKLKRMINEALDDIEDEEGESSSWMAPERPSLIPKGGYKSRPSAPPTAPQKEESEEELLRKNPEMAKLETLADEFGYSHGGGPRQWMQKLFVRLQDLSENVSAQKLEELQNYACAEYIDMLERASLIEPEDAEDMTDNMDAVKELGSFRYFLIKAFILPAFKTAELEKEMDIRDMLLDIGMPRQVTDTIFNYYSGRNQLSKDKMMAKVAKSLKKCEDEPYKVKERIHGGLTGEMAQLEPGQAREIFKKTLPLLSQIERRAKQPDDYLALGEAFYNNLSDSSKAEILISALEREEEDVQNVKSYKV